MVQIQSTWFPVIDRNPQKYVPSIYQATIVGFREGDAAGLLLARHAFSPGAAAHAVNTAWTVRNVG